MMLIKFFLFIITMLGSVKCQNLINNETLIKKCLDAHNTYRSQVGSPPLIWDANLAGQAANYAQHLMDNGGSLIHSAFGERPGQGENLAFAYSSSAKTMKDPYQMIVDQWILNERVNFVNNPIPNTMMNQFGIPTGHYTQSVWSKTKNLGIGVAYKDGKTVMVGRYSPPGNTWGEKTY